MIKVLILAKASTDGCTWYRLTQFANKSKELGIADVQFMDTSLPEDLFMETLKKADIFVCRLNDVLFMLLEQLDMAKLNKPLIIDIDDNYDQIHPLSNSYEALGTKEVQLGDGTYLWKDKIGKFDIEANKKRLKIYTDGLSRATGVITTTLELRNYALEHNPVSVVIPNCIEPKLFPRININKGSQVNLVWAGGSSHFADLQEIKPVLKEVLTNNPNVYYKHLGQIFGSIVNDLPKTEAYDWIEAKGHGYRLACMAGDIGLCPIEKNEFNKYKSSIKYYEYAALGMAVLARDYPPYSDDIVDGENGFLYKDNKEFKEKLELLIKDPILRTTLGNNAYNYVLKKRNLNDITRDWVEFLEGVVKAK